EAAGDQATRAPEIGESPGHEAQDAGDAVEQRDGPARLDERQAELGRERRQRGRHLAVLERAENSGEQRKEKAPARLRKLGHTAARLAIRAGWVPCVFRGAANARAFAALLSMRPSAGCKTRRLCRKSRSSW